MVCIVDREAQPAKRFAMTPDQLIDVGKQCRKYVGKWNFSRFVVQIHIIEVGPDAHTHGQIRLEAFQRLFSMQRVLASAWTVDTTSASVWTNAPPVVRFVRTSEIERLLRAPRDSAHLAQLVQARRAADAPIRPAGIAFVTYGLAATLIAVFACELVFGLDPATALTPSMRTLAKFGGLNSTAVRSGEWFRILSAPFLHLNPFHLAMNSLVLVIAGRMFEHVIGSAWFGVVYLVAAICGSLLSLAFNPSNLWSVGASGAIMGVVAAMWVCAFRFPEGRMRTGLQNTALGGSFPRSFPTSLRRPASAWILRATSVGRWAGHSSLGSS